MIDIQVLQPDDWQLWRSLRLQALAEAPHAFGATLADWQGSGDREQRWRARLAIPGSRNVIARLEGRPVGMVSGVPAERGGDGPDDDAIELISMWVSPEARGRGVGDQLVGEMERWAAGLGVRTMRLSVRPSNAAAVALYRRHGLKETGESIGDATPDRTDQERVMAKQVPGRR
ncbi:acyl-CoA N-acyltransferase [Parathielavia appendiculata]|uniref:Acyl-CoA N-acyltransferase n=1 Tax=Parathielavia appendiculata TaxID=2587402 RepID=A0AAN6TYN7_9PEZI|nr:acyl-CoA N-acyltransferase [Parathielavia appendiculata]